MKLTVLERSTIVKRTLSTAEPLLFIIGAIWRTTAEPRRVDNDEGWSSHQPLGAADEELYHSESRGWSPHHVQ